MHGRGLLDARTRQIGEKRWFGSRGLSFSFCLSFFVSFSVLLSSFLFLRRRENYLSERRGAFLSFSSSSLLSSVYGGGSIDCSESCCHIFVSVSTPIHYISTAKPRERNGCGEFIFSWGRAVLDKPHLNDFNY